MNFFSRSLVNFKVLVVDIKYGDLFLFYISALLCIFCSFCEVFSVHFLLQIAVMISCCLVWKLHLSFNKAHNFKGVLSVALVSRFFVLFGSFIKTQFNLDLSVQPALLL